MAHRGWYSRGYLPHFDSSETIQFVTFRLADSLPKTVAEALARSPNSLVETDKRLDDGLGRCWLRDPQIAAMVEDSLLYFDGERYRLMAWCIMPNHVHTVLMPSEGQTLGAIVQAWKSFSAKSANRLLQREGRFWHKDYFDRFIRDEGHFERTVFYVENNPVKAGLASSVDEWPWSSARFRTV